MKEMAGWAEEKEEKKFNFNPGYPRRVENPRTFSNQNLILTQLSIYISYERPESERQLT